MRREAEPRPRAETAVAFIARTPARLLSARTTTRQATAAELAQDVPNLSLHFTLLGRNHSRHRAVINDRFCRFADQEIPLRSVGGPTSQPCIVCASPNIVPILEIPAIPADTIRLWSSRAAACSALKARMGLTYCEDCGHLFNRHYDNDLVDYETDYENSQMFSPRFRRYAEELSDRLITTYHLHQKDIVEIGGGRARSRRQCPSKCSLCDGLLHRGIRRCAGKSYCLPPRARALLGASHPYRHGSSGGR